MLFGTKENRKLVEIGDGNKSMLFSSNYYHDWENDKQTVVLWIPESDPIAIRISVITLEGQDSSKRLLGKEHVEASAKKENQKIIRLGDCSYYSYTSVSSEAGSGNIFYCHIGFRNHVVIASVADDGLNNKKKEVKASIRDLLESIKTIAERDTDRQTIFDPKLSDSLDVKTRVESLVGKENYGVSGTYLRTIEQILESKPTDTYLQQTLGLVLGQYLVETNGNFQWVVVVDEYGRDISLRYKNNSVLVFPLTMISKRLEDGETVVVSELVAGVLEF